MTHSSQCPRKSRSPWHPMLTPEDDHPERSHPPQHSSRGKPDMPRYLILIDLHKLLRLKIEKDKKAFETELDYIYIYIIYILYIYAYQGEQCSIFDDGNDGQIIRMTIIFIATSQKVLKIAKSQLFLFPHFFMFATFHVTMSNITWCLQKIHHQNLHGISETPTPNSNSNKIHQQPLTIAQKGPRQPWDKHLESSHILGDPIVLSLPE